MGMIRNAWLQWKALRLPWRKKFLVGQDLAGNTFWEFRDVLNTTRMRRIVHKSPYAQRDTHYAEIPISPQWHQWLRQTRLDAPTIQEQQQDLARQIQLKQNARLADERWAAKARYIDKPKAKPQPMLTDDVRVSAGKETIEGDDSPKAQAVPKPGVKSQVDNPVDVPDPFEKAKETSVNPGATFQPESWSPGPSRKK